MLPMIYALLFALFFLFASAADPSPTYSSSIPLSPNSNAFSRGDLGSKVTVDLWIDLACSDCMNDWPLIDKVYQEYGKRVKFNYRLFPLPYHQFAFLLAKTTQVVSNHGEEEDVFEFIDAAYIPSNQALIYNSVTADMSYDDVLEDIVAKWVSNATSISEENYLKFMSTDYSNEPLADYNAEMNARYAFKNAAINGVIGTPTVWINGVEVDGLEDIDQWGLALKEAGL